LQNSLGTCAACGAGGKDIVDEDDVAPQDSTWIGDNESASRADESFVNRFALNVVSVAKAHKTPGIEVNKLRVRKQFDRCFGEIPRLVESALPQSTLV